MNEKSAQVYWSCSILSVRVAWLICLEQLEIKEEATAYESILLNIPFPLVLECGSLVRHAIYAIIPALATRFPKHLSRQLDSLLNDLMPAIFHEKDAFLVAVAWDALLSLTASNPSLWSLSI